MDTRDTAEQLELRRSARQLARELGPATVAGLDDAARADRLSRAVREAGWLELRDDDGTGSPLAGGVEAAIVADALGGSVADVAFAGPVLAHDLTRRAGAREEAGGEVVALSPDLGGATVVPGAVTTEPVYAVDPGDDTGAALVLVPEGSGYRLAGCTGRRSRRHEWDGPHTTGREIPPGTSVRNVADHSGLLTADDLAGWTALGLAITSADLVGVMRGVLEVTVGYAADRRQYGVPVGSFQAVQHLLAEAHCLMEGSLSVSLHASWAVDHLPPVEARAAGRVAKAYCARAARTVCETAVQVHGGIGNTWECIVHVYLRRALLSSQWFGDDMDQLRVLADERLGVTSGLS